MPYLLNVIYLALLVVLSPWLLVAAIRHGKYRQGWAAKFLGRVPLCDDSRPALWCHAVSVGEVNVLAPFLEQWHRRQPGWRIVISTTTRTGFELATRKYAQHLVIYCPLDFSWAVRRALRRINPRWLVLAELELWPNLIHAARRQGVRVAVINGRLSENSYRGYHRVRWFVRRLLAQVDVVAVQSATYADRFRQLGVAPTRLHVTGSLKFDGARRLRDNPATRELAGLWQHRADHIVLLAGSTQDPEEQLAIEAFAALADQHPRLQLVLVPRHPERFEQVARYLDHCKLVWQRRTHLPRDGRDPRARILLVDTIGELGAWWGLAQIAYVGGSMGNRGGQNMIEPAAYGAAVCFGPKTQIFRDVVQLLLERHAAVVVQNGAELTSFVRRCLVDPEWAGRLGQAAAEVVQQQAGAADRTVDAILTSAAFGAAHADAA